MVDPGKVSPGVVTGRAWTGCLQKENDKTLIKDLGHRRLYL
jgi:hypothetical protein